ncbi:MAG: sulfatase-like hydrolase/transferase [Planctomyces sp.]|nr:sulfatase-like hydrolase/transferase [Planctomyces sp.]
MKSRDSATLNGTVPQNFLYLTTLNAFAVLQPALDQMAKNPGFLRLEGFSAGAIICSVLIFMLAVPAFFTAIAYAAVRLKMHRTALGVFRGTSAVLCCLIMLYFFRWMSATFHLLSAGVPDFALAPMALIAGGFATYALTRSNAVRQIVKIAAVGVILFPVSFLMTPAIQELVLGIEQREYHRATNVANPVPVVMIVFDGMCGMSLLDMQHEVDQQRFPSFARLAEMSTHFRNATTVHTRTDHALPAMLSSCFPEEIQEPVESDYPANLFRLIYNSNQYAMTVFEPVTQMAPDELRQIEQELSGREQVLRLTGTLTRVLARMWMPRDLEVAEVSIPSAWFGLPDVKGTEKTRMRGKVVYSWDTDRGEQFRHFISTIKPSDQPAFRFFHVALPHYPWTLFPSGKSYSRVCSLSEPIYGLRFEEWSSDEWPVNLAWQRNLMQMQMADRCLGELLDTLEENGELRDCLLIVTADHGMAFSAGREMRTPEESTLGDIISVPLFLKLPSQNTGVVTDRNVEIVDILPTIAEVLGLAPDESWEGVSLLSAGPERPRKTVRGAVDTVLSPEFPERFDHVERLHRVFGSGGSNDQLGQLSVLPELTGRSIREFLQTGVSAYESVLRSSPVRLPADRPEFIPGLIEGRISENPQTTSPVMIAVAIDDVIVTVTRTSTDPHWEGQWSALLPDGTFAQDPASLKLYVITAVGNEASGSTYQLSELSWRVGEGGAS